MSIFEHARFQIWNQVQHPYRHNLNEFSYVNPAIGNLATNVNAALDYLFAVIYPQSKAAVDTPADLPLVGNTINDMRVVKDDGDGFASGYRWEQREGEVAASWHKIYDLNWAADSILAQWTLKAQDLYVLKYGYNERDASGAEIAGDLSGQFIYGGRTANTHLTLYANSGDGVGAQTGFIQFGDQIRPLVNNSVDLGETNKRFKKLWAYSGLFETMLLGTGSITDSTGAISFDNENLSTSGYMTFGTLKAEGGKISDTSGAISFDNEDLTTTGSLTANHVHATGAASEFYTGTTVGNLTLESGKITDSSGAISFDNENLSGTGTLYFGKITSTDEIVVDNLSLNGNTVSVTNLNGDLNLSANGNGKVKTTFPMETVGQTITGTVGITGSLNVDDITIDANTISTGDGINLVLKPTGAGYVLTYTRILPIDDNLRALGSGAYRFSTAYIGTSLSNNTNSILMTEVMALRNVLFRDAARLNAVQAGDSLFYDAVSGTWLASAPDTEITHSGLSGLTTGDAGHTQFALLAGRAGGQTLYGDTASGGHLTLDSTAHATKGYIKVGSTIYPTASIDLGVTGNRFVNVYTTGQFYGLRVENVNPVPASSALNVGRIVYDTVGQRLWVDNGSTFDKIGDTFRSETDTVWNGSDTTKTVTTSTLGMDARKAQWTFHDNNGNFEQIYAKLEALNATDVKITVNIALTAGTYRLIGLQ